MICIRDAEDKCVPKLELGNEGVGRGHFRNLCHPCNLLITFPMTTNNDTRFEDELSPFTRMMRRVSRALRWNVRTVLIETRWRLGDEVMALPMYEAVKKSWPNARVAALCNYPELLEGNPFVDEVNPSSPSPDRYIFLRDDARDTLRIEHYSVLAGIDTPRALPELYLIPEPTVSLPEGKRIAIAAGATWPTKRWPKAHWTSLITQLLGTGITTVELGAGHDPVGGEVNLIDQTSVTEAAAIIRACGVLITGDSGLMHLGLAAGARVIAIFGPTDPAMIVGEHPRLHVIDNGRECKGCWNRSLQMKTPGVCPRDIDECLETVSPEAVFAAAMEILDNAPAP